MDKYLIFSSLNDFMKKIYDRDGGCFKGELLGVS